MKLQLPPSVKNWLSLVGSIIALTALFIDQRQLLFPVSDNYNSRFVDAVGTGN